MLITNSMDNVTIIKPKKVFSLRDLKEIWQYKELLYFFTWRDLKVRYKQTIIGILWAIFQPFFVMVVFSIFFGSLAKMPSDGIPYPIFVYVGLLFWQFFPVLYPKQVVVWLVIKQYSLKLISRV